jgi:hypothetical protein
MTLVAYRYKCGSCGHDLLAPVAVGYGELVARSAGQGSHALLHGLDNPTYAEVDTLLSEMGAYANLSDRDRGPLLQTVFGVACDHDSDGSEFVVGAMPKCPTCGSRSMASWAPESAMRDDAIPTVTHVVWSQLTPEAKRKLLQARLRSLAATPVP